MDKPSSYHIRRPEASFFQAFEVLGKAKNTMTRFGEDRKSGFDTLFVQNPGPLQNLERCASDASWLCLRPEPPNDSERVVTRTSSA